MPYCVERLAVPGVVALRDGQVAERVEVGLGEAVDEQREVVAHRARVLHRHHVARRVGVGGARLGVDRPGARDDAAVLHAARRRRGAPRRGHEVEGAELVVVAPTTPVGVRRCASGRTPRRWVACAPGCPCGDRNPAATVAARGAVTGYDPFSVEVMTDPYPVYRELRAESPGAAAARVRRVRAHPLRRRVARAHRPRPLLDLRGPGVPPRRRCCATTTVHPTPPCGRPCRRSRCSTRRCTRSCARRCSGPFRPRAVAPHGGHGRAQFARARLDQLADATSSTCATTTRRRSPRRSRRCSSGSRSRTPSCW